MKWGAVVPARNEEQTLAKTLVSLRDQSSPPTVIITVDDGSCDNTALIGAFFGSSLLLKDRGYNAVGRPELANTVNAGIQDIQKQKINLDWILVAGSGDVFPRNYVKSVTRLAPPKTGLISGRPELTPHNASHVSGSGRLLSTQFLEKIGFQYPVIHGFESHPIWEARRLGYWAGSVPVPYNDRMGEVNLKSYVPWGQGRRALGYWWPVVWGSSARMLSRGKVRSSLQLLVGYYSKRTKHASPILKQFVKQSQVNKLRSVLL